MEFIKPERLTIKGNPELDEKWVQKQIAEDPSLLGLGDLILKDKERVQPKAGRLDLLLQDAETNRRYEVEVQLGPTDESHIIRTIEYWDIERKRYPQYDHCAVIVAEDVTSRFLNVIGLFNGSIPLIAIQMNAFKIDDKVGLLFTTVLDELTFGLEEDDEQEVTDRAYWEKKRGTKATLALVDSLLKMINSFAPGYELKYNKIYIGLAQNGQPNNFVTFRAKKGHVRLEPRLKLSDEIQTLIDTAGLDVMEYDKRWGRYRIRLTKGDIDKNRDILIDLMKRAHDASSG